MEEKFYTILTNIGKEKIANSSVLGNKVNFTKIKAGDGNGKYYEPTEDQTKLANTVWEGNIRNIEVSKENPNWIEIEAIILSDEGGFTIREFGVFDEEDNLLAISKCAETYKPIISDGSVKELLIKMVLSVSNTENVSLKVDPTIVVAKKSDVEKVDVRVDEISSQMKEIANKVDNIKIADGTIITKGIVKLNNATNSESQTEAATPLAVKTAMDKANEAFTSASNGKNYIAGKVGNVTGSNTFAQIGDRVQTDKNTAANNLSNKGVSASGDEPLASLAGKIANIELKSKEVYGTISIPERVDISSIRTYKISTGFKARIINIRYAYETLSVYSPNICYSNNGYYVRPVENGFEIYSQSNSHILDKGKELSYHVIGE